MPGTDTDLKFVIHDAEGSAHQPRECVFLIVNDVDHVIQTFGYESTVDIHTKSVERGLEKSVSVWRVFLHGRPQIKKFKLDLDILCDFLCPGCGPKSWLPSETRIGKWLFKAEIQGDDGTAVSVSRLYDDKGRLTQTEWKKVANIDDSDGDWKPNSDIPGVIV